MILCIGDATIDHYVKSGETFGGGIATNVAVHIHRQNEQVRLVAAIGKDSNGQVFLQHLEKEGLDTSHILELSGATSVQKIRLNGKQPTFFGFEEGVLLDFHLNDDIRRSIQKADLVFIPLSDGLKSIFEEVIKAERTAPLFIDISRHADIPGFTHGDVVAMLLHYIDHIDGAFIGGHEKDLDDVSVIAQANKDKLISLTMGPKGSIVWHQGKEYRQSALWRENMLDTTGCGDSYRAGFMVEYLRTENIPAAMKKGTEIATETAMKLGAF